MLRKRNLCILLAVCLIMLVCPCSAFAKGLGGGAGNTAVIRQGFSTGTLQVPISTPGDASAETGDFKVTGGIAGKDYRYENHVLYILTGVPITISGKTSSDRIYVENGVSANITLAGVDIQLMNAGSVPALEIAEKSTGFVMVTLAKGSTNTLKGGNGCAGVQKKGTGNVGTLRIRCQNAAAEHVCTTGCGSLSTSGFAIDGKLQVDGTIKEAASLPQAWYRLTVKNAKASGSVEDGFAKAGTTVKLEPADSDGKSFTGWTCTPADLKITGSEFTMPASAVIVEALYGDASYTVSFDLNGGKADKKIADQMVGAGGKVSAPQAVLTPPKGKCKLDGWYTADGKKWDFTKAVEASMTLTAKWTDHGTETKWIKDADSHEEQYTCCGAAKTEKEAHKWDSSGVCSVCGYECLHTKTEKKNRKSSSCTSEGYTGDEVCSACGKVIKKGTRISRSGHSYDGWEYDRSGHWRECEDCGETVGYASHTFTNWVAADGWRHERCNKCGYEITYAANGSVSDNTVPERPGSSSSSGPGSSNGSQSGGGTGIAVPQGPPVISSGGSSGPSTGIGAPYGAQPEANSGTNSGSSSGNSSGTGTVTSVPSGNSSGAGNGMSVPLETISGESAGLSSGTQPESGAGTAAGLPSGTKFAGGAGNGGGQAAGTQPQTGESQEGISPVQPEGGTVAGAGPAVTAVTQSGSNTIKKGSSTENVSMIVTVGEFIFEKIPWWFWIIVLVTIAAPIVAIVVISLVNRN